MGIFGKDHFYYHSQIRRYTVLFASLFDDLVVSYQKDGKTLYKAVSVKQSVGNLYENTKQNFNDRDNHNVAMVLPAMAVELVSFARADERKLNRNLDISSKYINADTNPNTVVQMNRMPYDFTFGVTIRTKTEDEMNQIVEQIAGAFNPDITFSVVDNVDLGWTQDVVVVCSADFQKTNNYTDIDELQYIEVDCSFVIKGYLYRRPTKNSIITSVTVSALFGKDVEDDMEIKMVADGEVVPVPSPPVQKTTGRKDNNAA